MIPPTKRFDIFPPDWEMLRESLDAFRFRRVFPCPRSGPFDRYILYYTITLGSLSTLGFQHFYNTLPVREHIIQHLNKTPFNFLGTTIVNFEFDHAASDTSTRTVLNECCTVWCRSLVRLHGTKYQAHNSTWFYIPCKNKMEGEKSRSVSPRWWLPTRDNTIQTAMDHGNETLVVFDVTFISHPAHPRNCTRIGVDSFRR